MTEMPPRSAFKADSDPAMEQLAINTIRTLSIDAVEKANSGHPGTPMGMAPVVYTLWQDYLRYDPADPIWPNRDRFVLSVGHASMLLYSILHLTGVKSVDEKYEITGTPAVSLDDIKKFRQIDSKCPGHPEYHLTTGVEATTGPLGQGVANSVGMALAAKWQENYFNKPDAVLFDYNVYALMGDGCMMEGISAEAASLAGHLQLSNLCWIYDSNRVTIDGHTDITFSESVAELFKGYQWNVVEVADANDLDAVRGAIETFQKTKDKPTLIIVHSHIGYGAPDKQDSPDAHGEPLGEKELKAAKRFYGWPEDAQFLVPDGVYEHFQNGIGKRGKALREEWQKKASDYNGQYKDLALHLVQMQKGGLPQGWDKDLPVFEADEKGIASRESSFKVMNAIGKNVPWFVGGAADLTKSTKTIFKFEGAGVFAPGQVGRNINFGIREHAMGAIANGLALSKLRAFDSTFLIFSDYMRMPIRLSSLMELPMIHIFTHDSIGVGEDGPTHQPVEQILSLRAIPGMIVLRPCDANEVTEAWRVIMQQKHQPVCLILSRQNLPTLDRKIYAPASGLAKGAYVLAEAEGGKPDVIIIGTGSEIAMCLDAYKALTAKGVKARVVSMPSWELFEIQDQSYRDQVLPPDVKARVSVEQASSIGWAKYVGMTGATIGMHTFGSSAPLKDLQKKFGFSPDKIAEAAEKQIAMQKGKNS
jgi:transketolase